MKYPYEIHKDCGHIVNRKDIPCPQDIPGCAVRHFRFECVKHGVINPDQKESIMGEDYWHEKWRFLK